MTPTQTEIVSAACPHPLDPASIDELNTATELVRKQFDSDVKLFFYAAGLHEPAKKILRPFLQAERAGMNLNVPAREIYVIVGIARTPRNFEVIVNVTEEVVKSLVELPRTSLPPLVPSEITLAMEITMASDLVKAEVERLQMPLDQVFPEAWDYGRDSENEYDRKVQVFMYARNPETNHPESNVYAFPLDFLVILDMTKEEVESIQHLPLGASAPKNRSQNTTRKTGKPIEPEYVHELQSQSMRKSVKPLQVIQPEGPGFQASGNLIEWEKWRFRVGFNWREGMTLHDVTFDGREVLYRIALSEMSVPYGDPRAPLHRKSAFDLGTYGAGYTANNLGLGCDCLGVIKYLDGHLVESDGRAYTSKNVICIHEVDAGIQWKHTNLNTGKAVVVRRRQLHLQMIITVANYEYAFYFILDQSGEIMFETLATGILSTTPIDPEETKKCRFGTRVASGVLAPYHQHIFNLRIDPCIDGDGNSVEVIDSVPMPLDEDNPYGIGYVTESRTVSRSGTEQLDAEKGRVFKIVNPNRINATSGQPVGYKLVPIVSQRALAHPTSWHARRSQFGSAPVWITRYRDHELYAAGNYTNQSDGDDGLQAYVARDEPVENQDIVLWHTFSFTHNPRPEDFPVMPCETARVVLKPNGFFDFNPTLDVPPSSQCFNRSVSYEESKRSAGIQTSGQEMPCCKT
ncbi:primary-amine oxidase [Malassezia yamatoensis]|uniref:Amine oxidase n=1 Tax=Malassezia yamatoensis TaxID=253288 RepID=A0AAJ5YYF4_9BASI|nr:primary-amine oxidase [Malassezia yamatoensis]